MIKVTKSGMKVEANDVYKHGRYENVLKSLLCKTNYMRDEFYVVPRVPPAGF